MPIPVRRRFSHRLLPLLLEDEIDLHRGRRVLNRVVRADLNFLAQNQLRETLETGRSEGTNAARNRVIPRRVPGHTGRESKKGTVSRVIPQNGPSDLLPRMSQVQHKQIIFERMSDEDATL